MHPDDQTERRGSSSQAPPADKKRKVVQRSRLGCLTCRQTRVKCDEVHPICGRCKERGTHCSWREPAESQPRRHRYPRQYTACDTCRNRRTKCGGPIPDSSMSRKICGPCVTANIPCHWTARRTTSETVDGDSLDDTRSISPFVDFPPSSSTRHLSNSQTYSQSQAHDQPAALTATSAFFNQILNEPAAIPPAIIPHISPAPASFSTPQPSGTWTSIIHPSEADLVKDLLRLYFTTIHHFGYLSFMHEADFWDRFEKKHVPEELVLIMAANALRYGGQHKDQGSIDTAERWAALVGDRLLPLVFNEFGAVELMAVVLYQHYEFCSGRYSRGWTLAGTAVRMMTFLRLHILDELPPPTFRPLLGVESLRRLAWAVYYLDATLDGGNFGQSNVVDGSFTIQLPCEDRLFLQHKKTVTEPLIPSDITPSHTQLPLAAHLLRAISARGILASLHSRIQRRLVAPHEIEVLVRQAEHDALRLLDSLPSEMHYNRAQYHVYKDQLPLLLHLHVMRNTARRHLGLLKILVASQQQIGHDPVSAERKLLIRDTHELSAMFSDAAEHRVVLDPQLAMHAYNGIEILLFQSTRLSMQGIDPGITRDCTARLLKPLLHVVRDIAQVCDLVALIHPEAVNRMVRMGLADDLTNDDFMAVLKKVHCLANSDSEFDFNESFWRYELSIKRTLPHEAGPVSPNDVLLELRSETSPNGRLPMSDSRIGNGNGTGTGSGTGIGAGTDNGDRSGIGNVHNTNRGHQAGSSGNGNGNDETAFDKFQSLLSVTTPGSLQYQYQGSNHFLTLLSKHDNSTATGTSTSNDPNENENGIGNGDTGINNNDSHGGMTQILGLNSPSVMDPNAAFAFPFEDLQTMMGTQPGVSTQNSVPFMWSFLDGVNQL